MADDRLALEISYLRIAADGIRISPEAMDMDGVGARFGRAADALEAVLKMADRALVTMRDPDGKPWLWDLRAGEIREAITRALSGEASDGDAIAWTPRCAGCNGFCGTCEAAVREDGGSHD